MHCKRPREVLRGVLCLVFGTIPVRGRAREVRKTELCGERQAIDVDIIGDRLRDREWLVACGPDRARRHVELIVSAHLHALVHHHRCG